MITKPTLANTGLNQPTYIMGLGWLGLPLSRQLLDKGTTVSGTVTSKEKQKILLSMGLDVDIFDLYSDFGEQFTGNKARVEQRFNNANLVLNIPPGRRQFNKDKYVTSIINLVNLAMEAGLRRLIFISTTSVFGTQTGIIVNTSELTPNTESGNAHQKIEHYLLSNYPNRVKILRPAGLIGSNIHTGLRHPIFTLCHKKNIDKGQDPVNLVHQADVIQAINVLIEKETQNHTYNIAALEHPSRKDYYTWCAKRLKLSIPGFVEDTKKRQLGKLIDATETYSELGISAKYSSPYAMLDA